MDLAVYTKELVSQPDGTESVYVPDVIDLKPVIEEIDGVEYITNALTVEGEEEVEQQCALATIWQRGLDPVDLSDGIEWSESLLGEVSVIQIMQELIEAVQRITLTVTVNFETVLDDNGNPYFSYILKAVS